MTEPAGPPDERGAISEVEEPHRGSPGRAGVRLPEGWSKGARVEAGARSIGLWLGPAAAALTWLLAGGLPPDERTLSALMVLCAVWWMTEPVPMPVTGLVAAALAVVTGLAPPKQVFAAFGNPLLFLFVGSFFIAEAIKVHGLGRRLAGELARRARGRLSLVIALSASTGVLSMWMSNTAATAIAQSTSR